MLLPEWSPAVFFCLVIVVHESLVCPDQLNCLLFFRKILQLPQILWFFSIFVYSNPFQQWLYNFEIHLFTLRTTEGLICNYYRRFKHSLMLEKEKHALRAGGNLKIRVHLTYFVFCETCKYSIFCSFWRAVLNKIKKWYLGKIRKMYTSSFCSKVFTFLVFKFYKFS